MKVLQIPFSFSLNKKLFLYFTLLKNVTSAADFFFTES